MARLYVSLKTDPATGTLRFQDHDVFGQGVRIVPIGLSTPLRLPCPLHGGWEVVDTVGIGGGDLSGAAGTLLILGHVLLSAANRRCDTFLAELNALRVAFCEGLVGIPLAESGLRMYEVFIDAVGAVLPFEHAVAALADSRLPAVVADANPRSRRAVADREERPVSDLVVGADGTPLPPGVPAWHLPHRGRGVWSWCEQHQRWHCQAKASWPSRAAEITYAELTSVAVWRHSGSCDEYRIRKESFRQASGPPTLYAAERPELTMLWYRAWARALRAALRPARDLAAAMLTL